MGNLIKCIILFSFYLYLTTVECGSCRDSCANSLAARPKICGKDGKTYTDDCAIKCAGVEYDYRGECRPGGKEQEEEEKSRRVEVECKTEKSCAEDFKNMLKEKNITAIPQMTIFCRKTCTASGKLPPKHCDVGPKKPEECKCALEANFVGIAQTCGKDGVTYETRCHMECACISMDHPGPCKSSGSSVKSNLGVIKVGGSATEKSKKDDKEDEETLIIECEKDSCDADVEKLLKEKKVPGPKPKKVLHCKGTTCTANVKLTKENKIG